MAVPTPTTSATAVAGTAAIITLALLAAWSILTHRRRHPRTRRRLTQALNLLLILGLLLGMIAPVLPVRARDEGTAVLHPPAAVNAPWSNDDIGNVAAAGTADESGGVFTITGSGADIGGTAENGGQRNFISLLNEGDGESRVPCEYCRRQRRGRALWMRIADCKDMFLN